MVNAKVMSLCPHPCSCGSSFGLMVLRSFFVSPAEVVSISGMGAEQMGKALQDSGVGTREGQGSSVAFQQPPSFLTVKTCFRILS